VPQSDLLAVLPFDGASPAGLVLPPSLSRVDRAILQAALGAWRGGTFADAVARLRRATEETIPAGRVYLLAQTPLGRVIGSLVSGVGIAMDTRGLLVVRTSAADAAGAADAAEPARVSLAAAAGLR
jgi:hypothetical protein